MSSQTEILIPFHENRNYEDQCIDLLNSEWPRSRIARLRSLEKSCDQFPVALLFLVQIDEICPDRPTLIGHACLCTIPNRPRDCWLQTVVVEKELRGKGFGKRLMMATEKYAKEKYEIDTIYLSTHDRRGFYETIGYELCEPIFNVGANAKLLNDEKFQKFTQSIGNRAKSDDLDSRKSENLIKESMTAPPPPPPPPPPPKPLSGNGIQEPEIVFMKKKLI